MSATTPRPRLATATPVESSELSRNADLVFRAAEEGPVLIARPDGEPLLLISQGTADEVDQVLAAVGSLIGIMVSATPTIRPHSSPSLSLGRQFSAIPNELISWRN